MTSEQFSLKREDKALMDEQAMADRKEQGLF